MKTSPNVKHVREQVRACIFKFYPEMFLGDEIKDDVEKEKAVELMKTFISAVVSDVACPYSIHAIIHDKCHAVPELHKPKKPDKDSSPAEIEKYNSDLLEYKQKREAFFWSPLLEKEHLHVLCITKSKCPVNIETIFNYFASKGLKIRRDADTNGFLHGWVQKINMKQKRHICMMVYHTHETDEARAEGKYLYNRSDVYTNISVNVLESWYQEYFVSISKLADSKEYDFVSKKPLELGRNIAKLGTKSFRDYWLEDVPYVIQKKTNLKSLASEYYEKGVDEFLASPESIVNVRCSIFINGSADAGKTTTSVMALGAMGFTPYEVKSGGTGKFDNLSPSNKSIVVSDTSFGDIFAMTDNAFCRPYRRNSGNRVFTGQYVIITYNGSLDKYLSTYYRETKWFSNPESVKAIKSRFYEAEIRNDGKLHFIKPSLRGTDEDIYKRNLLCLNFKNIFNKMIEGYTPKTDAHKAQLTKDFLEMMGENVHPVPAVAPAPAVASAPAPALAPCQETLDLLSLPAKGFLDDFVKLPC